jgi:hypothetical protein
MSKIVWQIPMKTVSEANCSQHWRVKANRHKAQQFLVRSLFRHEAQKIPFPCCVTFTRLASRAMDNDNLTMCFKFIRDEVSECLIPEGQRTVLNAKGRLQNLKGRVDSDPRILWQYRQLKSKIQGIRIEIEELTESQKFETASEAQGFIGWD